LICGMDDADGLAAIMAKLARDPALRADLSARGLEHVKRFQWSRTAQALLGYCHEAVS
jgi:glycosyltransferase involved in cell wall biosynthesis